MENYQMLTIIGTNLAVFLTFMGISISLIIHMNRRIDAAFDSGYKRRKRRR